MLEIETVAALSPTLVGLSLIVKVVLSPDVIVVSVELIFTENSKAFMPVIMAIGEPVKFKFAKPIFSIVKIIARLEEFTDKLPKS